MYTLLTILAMWGLISTYRIHKTCQKKTTSFNVAEGNFVDFSGFCYGWAAIILLVMHLMFEYLP